MITLYLGRTCPQDSQLLKGEVDMPTDNKHDTIASYAIGAPWPGMPNEICFYCFGSPIFSGTLRDAERTLEKIQNQALIDRRLEELRTGRMNTTHPAPEDYQIYQLVPIKAA
jgi:hypothetical protein